MNKKQSESEKLCGTINSCFHILGIIVLVYFGIIGLGLVLALVGAYPFTFWIILVIGFVIFMAWLEGRK